MNKVICDKCGREIKVKLKAQKIDDAERVYFQCQFCKTEYTAYYTNDEIKAKQERIRNLQGTYNLACKKHDRVQAERLFKQVNNLQREIKADMIKLKNLHGGR